MRRTTRHPWQYRRLHWRRLRAFLRPVCFVKGHRSRMLTVAVFVAESAPKPPSTVCDRCGGLGR